ncbi:hypothetical protein A3A03_03075 [Candidatus Nomurabacteria bacterium RIFCSPLOWO2_01_FULL_40_18]|uniref:DNA polymerase III delta N-terminal domain-containing protein n=1 Tax=Candidatus Nomurabacteria bacterium RIFCSPLOWO2_01_FULL_40_18 TaxID=1801773 RepID=A0A1F6XK97_9BACT|nr:MAG: hypothetical protein A3A03_03075 [Candidatus Nomurabacteria bacterium RIFCSPLOWO2_01_FULL_40_18]
MIYLFSGDDTKNKILSYEKFLKSVPTDTEIIFINRNDFDPMQIESLYSGSSLFSAKSAVVFSNIFEYEETRDFILEKLKLMGESANSFIFLEGKLTKPVVDAFKKARAELNIFELPKEKKEKFDNFLVANAFERKDKLNMWIYFCQAMDKGVGMEEIIGVLFWKIKDMIIKKDFRKFSEPELKNSATRLSYLLPEARKIGLDAESSFEQFLLEVF